MIRTLLRIQWINLRRDRLAQLLTFVVPVAFFTIFALIFGGRGVTLRLDRAPERPIDGLAPTTDATTLTGTVLDVDRELPALLQRVAAAGHAVEDLDVRRPSLQSVFLHLTGRELRE